MLQITNFCPQNYVNRWKIGCLFLKRSMLALTCPCITSYGLSFTDDYPRTTAHAMNGNYKISSLDKPNAGTVVLSYPKPFVSNKRHIPQGSSCINYFNCNSHFVSDKPSNVTYCCDVYSQISRKQIR